MSGSEQPDPADARTLERLAETLSDVSPEALAEAVEALVTAGVLVREPGPDGKPVLRYAHPERYRLIDVPDVKVPGPDFGRR